MVDGYLDLQVNGYGGVDFNQDDLSAEQLHTACELLRDHGVGGILATIITEDLDRMTRRLGRIVELRERDELARRMILGFHIEGPFISPQEGYRGAHPRDAVRPAKPDEMERLLEAAGGLTRIVTLAPEVDEDRQTIRMLVKRGVVASAGHCNPSVDQLKAAIDAGLSMFTHLGNGCPMLMHRHDNIIQRVLSLADRLWLMFIADGVHVPFVALGNYLKLAGLERCIVVTDAIAPAGRGPGRYSLGRWDLVIGEDLVARSPDGSHFVGSGLTMRQAHRNLRGALGLTESQIIQLTQTNPRAAVRAN
ncbi:MAG: N-acetylglucosamine-6-phosphate deacetylase [Bacillota bacterium]